jgi:large subunit ribosomal protein L6
MAISRIGKQPIKIPSGVKVSVNGQKVSVEGPKGKLEHVLVQASASVEGEAILVKQDDGSKNGKAMHGLARALLSNMVEGVSKGFTRVLEINGVGYRAELKGQKLEMNLGFSHPVVYELPKGVSAQVEKLTTINLASSDKQLLGQVAAKIRGFRPPEPYKGKGVKYSDEHIIRKVGKAGTK